ncbi:CsbD family protein [Laspinema olomoucense]|uniref:CsbD family protein n=1 Tax=Laspinema olomoucense D3b TaxID=2953688 RepID=A0ABT2N6Y8_9CYAN|nr:MULTISPECIES: CsbD family protein [unclassified Laspinema]MCT7974054.1 CsbD family protein [Laspinema sp. D3d]MCT7978463.1 CsbD family protein [Laspinema sp. D3b]MCT7991098.1 CsbD family protein [Laspinema sp. D3a]
MSVENRMKATAKNIEGKAQEAFGDLTGDPKQKAVGIAKQIEANIEHGVENLKEELDIKKDQVEKL